MRGNFMEENTMNPNEKIYKTFGIRKIRQMKNHPFKVKDNDDMKKLMESIRENGVLNPIIVRPMQEKGINDETLFEIVSGHRRFTACLNLGMKTIPTIIRDMTDEQAVVAMVDSNLHREKLLPSEKAFAYKMKMDVLSKQGKRTDLTSSQLETKSRSDEQIAEETGESRATVQRYIRLTYLEESILDLVDEGKIALSPAVELSYLPKWAQLSLAVIMERNECTPSYSQAVRLHKELAAGTLDNGKIKEIMSEEKANQRETVKLPSERLYEYFPRDYTPADITDAILRILEERKRQGISLPTKPEPIIKTSHRKSIRERAADIQARIENERNSESPQKRETEKER